MMRSRDGMTLLEVIVALALVGAVAGSVLGLATQSWHAVRSARDADRSLVDASAFMHAVALWPREDLDRHLGDRRQAPWRLRIDRPSPTLYTVALTDSSGTRTLLATSLYRPEAPRVP